MLLVAYSAAVSLEQPPGGVRLWMALFDAATDLLISERRRLRIPPGGDPLLRDLRPLAHLLDLRRTPPPRAALPPSPPTAVDRRQDDAR